jgi:hypothetical protein
VAVNLSNTPFRGTVWVDTRIWKEIDLPVSKPEIVAVPFVALDAFGVRIYQRATPLDHQP